MQVTKGKTKPDFDRDDYVHAIGAVASRDGKYLYYTKRNKLFNAYNNLEFPLSQVTRRDRATGDEDTITDAHGSGFRPVDFARWNACSCMERGSTTRPDCGSAT